MSAQPQPTTSPPFTKAGHAGHCIRCLQGLPASQVTLDPSRCTSSATGWPPATNLWCNSTAIGFYSLGCLDILGLVDTKTIEIDRQGWKTWFWELQSSLSVLLAPRIWLVSLRRLTRDVYSFRWSLWDCIQRQHVHDTRLGTERHCMLLILQGRPCLIPHAETGGLLGL